MTYDQNKEYLSGKLNISPQNLVAASTFLLCAGIMTAFLCCAVMLNWNASTIMIAGGATKISMACLIIGAIKINSQIEKKRSW